MDVKLTADAMVLNNKGELLVVKRKYPPFQGMWALPGGMLEEGETFQDAMYRELEEETGIPKMVVISSKDIGIFDAPNRDPRGRVITVAYLVEAAGLEHATAGDDAESLAWIWPGDLQGKIAFDHWEIIRKGMCL